MKDIGARRTIEALRSGVPSRAAVAELGTTQTEIEGRFLQGLEGIENGGGSSPIVVSANFGDGKSHLLRCLQAKALANGFVTSFVVVSPETPLGNGHLVLKAIAESAEAPGRPGKAVMELASSAPANAAAELVKWARQATIADRFRAMLRIYDASSADEELRVLILGDIEGRPLIKTRIKDELKKLGEASHFDLASPRNALLAHDRIRLMAQFARCHGAKGIVVFFDELERLGSFSFKARAAAYEELGWWKQVAEEVDSCLLPVFAQTAGAAVQCLEEKGDRAKLQQSSDLLADEKTQLVLDGMLLFDSDARLSKATNEQLETLQHGVREIYNRAYGTEPSVVSRADERTVRAEIRRWITIWDMQRHYPDYKSEVISGDPTLDNRDIADDELAQEEA